MPIYSRLAALEGSNLTPNDLDWLNLRAPSLAAYSNSFSAPAFCVIELLFINPPYIILVFNSFVCTPNRSWILFATKRFQSLALISSAFTLWVFFRTLAKSSWWILTATALWVRHLTDADYFTPSGLHKSAKPKATSLRLIQISTRTVSCLLSTTFST